jgi:hypothetical protein
LSFHCFENPTVFHAIQSWSSDQNVPLPIHCFENLTVLHAFQSRSRDQNVPLPIHCFESLIEILISPFLFIVFSRVSPVLTRYVLAMKSSTLLQCQPMKLSYNIRLYIIQYCTRSRDWKRGWRK